MRAEGVGAIEIARQLPISRASVYRAPVGVGAMVGLMTQGGSLRFVPTVTVRYTTGSGATN
jgi:hypothetical protein